MSPRITDRIIDGMVHQTRFAVGWDFPRQLYSCPVLGRTARVPDWEISITEDQAITRPSEIPPSLADLPRRAWS